jgi:general secretion pathway protein I
MTRYRTPYHSFRFGDQRPAGGFTLLEVMVALAVMSIVLVSVYRMHSQSLSMNATARFYTVAPMLAQGKLAELTAFSPNAFIEDSGNFGEGFEGYTWKSSEVDVTSEVLGEVAEDLKRIEITVSYHDDQMVYHLRTYRFQRN